MPYLIASDLPTATAGARFRAALSRPGILRLPGAHNGMAALQAKAAGFEALYLSGAAMTASMGLPDLGIITVDEVAFFIRQITRASGLPLLVDGDTGYGEALNVMHMVRSFEEAGAGAVHLEDQLLPKKCGHLNDKKLASAQDMAAKVAAAARARRDLVIIARTDAAASEGKRLCRREQIGFGLLPYPVSFEKSIALRRPEQNRCRSRPCPLSVRGQWSSDQFHTKTTRPNEMTGW